MIEANYAHRDEIKTVILDDEIYDRVSDDHCPPKEEFEIPFNHCNFIGGYVDGEIASLFIVHDKKLHFMVLKNFRRHAKELLKASFSLWPRDVYVEIPLLYKSVINFAKKFGFKEIGIKKNAHLKNGRQYDSLKLLYEVKHGFC